MFAQLPFLGNPNCVLAEPRQMVFFNEYLYEAPLSEPLHAPYSRNALGRAIGLAVILVSWLPIAWLIWTLT